MKYFISAGEASGDLHAAELISALRQADAEARFTFLGGDLMAEASGEKPLVHYRDMAYMGFVAVVRHAPEILRFLAAAKQAILTERPDAVILVDYPGFNMKLGKYAASLGIPVYYYISPKVWAWKEHRVKTLKRIARRILSILPFEVEWFSERHGYKVDYVGNPSAEEIDRRIAEQVKVSAIEALERPYIALVPGSRRSEIATNLPVMLEAVKAAKGYHAVVAKAPGIEPEYYDRWLAGTGVAAVEGATFELMAGARAALVTSGTATLECALLGTPQVACYRANGSAVLYNLRGLMLKVKYVTLPNLIVGRQIIPELLLSQCTPQRVAAELLPLLADGPEREAQLEGYRLMRSRLGDGRAASGAASLIVGDLRCQNAD